MADQVAPGFYARRIAGDLGALHHYLPDGALMHDPNAYLRSTATAALSPKTQNISSAGIVVQGAPRNAQQRSLDWLG